MNLVNTSFFEEINENDKDTKEFLREDINMVDKNNCYCTICEKNLIIDEKHKNSRIDRHVFSQYHIKRKIAKNKLIKSFNNNSIDFHRDLVVLFANLNIPMNKVETSSFIEFMKKHNGVVIKSRKGYKTILLEDIHPKQLQKNYTSLSSCDFYIQLDGSRDYRHKNIYNVIGDVLEEGYSKQRHIVTIIRIKVGHSEDIMSVVTYVVEQIHNKPTPCNNFKLFITDGASSCLKPGKNLKVIYKSMLHVTCMTHFLNNLTLKIIGKYSTIKQSIDIFVKIFQNSPNKKSLIKEKFRIKLENISVKTRFATYLVYGIFLYDNWQIIMAFLESDKNDSKSFKKQRSGLLKMEEH